jgi:hypothetical protein
LPNRCTGGHFAHQVLMRRPNRGRFEFAILLFLTLAPMAYFTLRGLIALAR